jgi:NAD(P)-dependent dehydrogenase (short-subunit alcohol dehydrogenase family)
VRCTVRAELASIGTPSAHVTVMTPVMTLGKALAAGGLLTSACLLALRARRRPRRMRLDDKVVLVCGASRGLGRAIAREAAGRGARVAICARSQEGLEDARSELSSRGFDVYAERCDLRSMPQVLALVSNVTARLGPIDVVVANAATISVGPFEATTESDFDEAMESIYKTSLHAALAVAPRMRQRRRGTIAFVTSIGGKIGVPHLAPYSAAKFAEVGLAEALRAELAKDGVHVLTIVPGLMRTGSHLHGRFRGDPRREYAWFAASAIAPLLSIDADRAARRIVTAIERGASELVFTLPARLASRLHGLFPGPFRELLGIAARLLPTAPSAPQTIREAEGVQVERASAGPLFDALKRRSAAFAGRHGQTSG